MYTMENHLLVVVRHPDPPDAPPPLYPLPDPNNCKDLPFEPVVLTEFEFPADPVKETNDLYEDDGKTTSFQ